VQSAAAHTTTFFKKGVLRAVFAFGFSHPPFFSIHELFCANFNVNFMSALNVPVLAEFFITFGKVQEPLAPVTATHNIAQPHHNFQKWPETVNL